MLHMLHCSSVAIQAICANATSLTHGYDLYVVTMHNKGAIYSRHAISNYPLTCLILGIVYFPFYKGQFARTK